MNFSSGLCVSDKVAFLLLRIAPLPRRIPVPGFHHQFGVLPVGDGLPSRAENLFQQRIFEQVIGSSGTQAVNGGAQGVDRAERVSDMGRIRVDGDLLRRQGN